MGGRSAVKNPRKVFSQSDSPDNLIARIINLEGNVYKVTYYEIISGASGSLTLPTGATINAGEFGLSGNCILSEIDGSNKPTYISPVTSGGAVVTASLNTSTGAWVKSDVTTSTNVALIYSINISGLNYSNLNNARVIETINTASGSGGGGTPATVAEINTGVDNAKFATPLNLETSKYLTQYGMKLYSAATGTNTYVATLAPAITSYQIGATYRIYFANANTAITPTINFNGLSAKTLTKKDGTALAINDITQGWYTISYDGTYFRGDFGLSNQLNAKADKVTGLVSGGVITIQTIDGTGTLNDARVAAATWYLSSTGLNYSTAGNTDFLNLTLSAAGNQRYVGFYGDNTSVITKVEGSEAITASYPATPVNTALIGYVLIGDAGASPTEPIGGYLPKADKATPADAVTGTNDALYVTSLSLAERMKVRTVTVASSATPSFNHNNGDIARLTGLSTNMSSASTNLTGTVYHGKMFSYEITDNGTARTITFGSLFASTSILTLPTTTVANQLLRCLFQYNAANSKWEIISIA